MAEEKKTSTKPADSRTIPDKANVLSGLGVVEGGAIPYKKWALKQRDKNKKNLAR